MVRLSVIVEPRQWGGRGQLGAVVPKTNKQEENECKEGLTDQLQAVHDNLQVVLDLLQAVPDQLQAVPDQLQVSSPKLPKSFQRNL